MKRGMAAVVCAVWLYAFGEATHGADWTLVRSDLPALHAIWGSAANDVFAVGDGGAILHYDGAAWSAMTSGTDNALFGLWGSSANDVIAVGALGTALHYDGAAWSFMAHDLYPPNPLFGVWGSRWNDVYAVGMMSSILHYNGVSWSTMPSGTTYGLNAIWGSAANDIYAVGFWGTIVHFAGSVWSAASSPTTDGLNGIWGSAANDVYAVGNGGTILHFNGASWSVMDSGFGSPLSAVRGISGDDVYAIGNGHDYLGNHGAILHGGAASGWRSGETDLGDNWRWLGWFGMYNMVSDPWVFHRDHGWLFPIQMPDGGIFFYDVAMSRFWWTNPAIYPFLYRFGDNPAWLWYQKDTTKPRRFYNVAADAWESSP